jgi:uncharacterized protein (DUF433 family)
MCLGAPSTRVQLCVRIAEQGWRRREGGMSARTNGRALVDRPLYSYGESDYLAQVTPGTSKRWLDGYQYWRPSGERVAQPPVTPGSRPDGGVTFLDLMEITAIGLLKQAGFSLPRIRDIVSNCQDILGLQRPLVTVQFKTDGREIFVDQGAALLEVGRRKGQQAWNEFLAPFLEEIDYEHELARRWYPLGRDKLVVIDPAYGHGLPVVRDTGVRTEIVFERFQVGESIREIAGDFNIQPDEVEQALQLESRLAKRAA